MKISNQPTCTCVHIMQHTQTHTHTHTHTNTHTRRILQTIRISAIISFIRDRIKVGEVSIAPIVYLVFRIRIGYGGGGGGKG